MFQAIEEKSGAAWDRVSGGMEDASQTLTGLLTTLKDDMDATLGEMMEPFIPILKQMIPVIQDTLVPLFRDHLAPAIERSLPFITTLFEAFSPFMGLFMDFASQLAESMQPAMEKLMPMLLDLVDQLGPKMDEIFPALADAFIAIAEAIVELSPFIPVMLDMLTGVTIAQAKSIEAIASAFAWIADIMAGPIATVTGELLSLLGDFITLDWDGATARVQTWIDAFTNAMPSMFNWLMEQWNKLDFSIDVDLPSWMGGQSIHTGDIFPDVNARISAVTPINTGNAQGTVSGQARRGNPAFHDGGMFRAPMGQNEGLALLRNNEVVFTPEQMNALGNGGGGSVRVIEVPVYLDGRQIARASTRGHDIEEKVRR
jgi:hypothetical protein